MKEIKCDCKLVTKVDDDDFFILSQFKWTIKFSNGNAYAFHSFLIDGKRKAISLHRLIMKAQKGSIIDHIDGDGLNNQKNNLRICSVKENSMNSRCDKLGSSKYKGVSINYGRRNYYTTINGAYLGSFDDEIKAAEEYDKKAKELFGEFARLNFPNK